MTDIKRRVCEIYCEMLEVEEVTEEDDVISLGGDSIQAVRIALELEKVFDLEIPVELLEERGQIRQVIAFVEMNAGTRAVAAGSQTGGQSRSGRSDGSDPCPGSSNS